MIWRFREAAEGGNKKQMSLLKQSENWGVVAPAFGIVASLLTLPPLPVRSKIEATPCVLTAIPEGNIWIEYFGQCVFRAGIVLFGTFGLAVMIPFAANFLHNFLR